MSTDYSLLVLQMFKKYLIWMFYNLDNPVDYLYNLLELWQEIFLFPSTK